MYERSVINREYVYVHYTFTSTRVESTSFEYLTPSTHHVIHHVITYTKFV